MMLHELPPEVLDFLSRHAASPRLIAHLIVVHDVAVTLVRQINVAWPTLTYDQESVLIGAAIHDVGKTIYTNELTGPGNQHEEIGPQLLLQGGFPEKHARFARTHGRWDRESSVQLEDVLVAFVDTIWKGKRDEALEQELARQIARRCHVELWDVYMKLDDIACGIANDAHDRILWQGKHPL